MDICDIAQLQLEQHEKAASSHIDTRKQAPYTGRCLWCLEPTGNGHRWCCIECRDEWEKDNLLRSKNATITGKKG